MSLTVGYQAEISRGSDFLDHSSDVQKTELDHELRQFCMLS